MTTLNRNIEFSPVWISSVRHLEIYRSIIKDTPLLEKMKSNYEIPLDFPKLIVQNTHSLPIVHFSTGVLLITDKSINYKAVPQRNNFLKSIVNTKDDLLFEVEFSKIKSIDRYQVTAFINYFSVNWVRIRFEDDILNGDILICNGGKGPFMNGINKKTNNLYKIITQRI